MKWFRDGDNICVTKDDFVNLAESPAVFIPKDYSFARAILSRGLRGLPLPDQRFIKQLLESGGGSL